MTSPPPRHNEEEFIDELLSRVIAAPLPDRLDREIVVVDDCSSDGSAVVVENFTAPSMKARICHRGCETQMPIREARIPA
jgi:glycosyltransferase involved in cell wall biosynthesis